MDIKSIIDADPAPETPKRSVLPLYNSPTSFQSPYANIPPFYPPSRDNRPPQPPPLQPPAHNDFRSPSVSSYNSVQSPYQPSPMQLRGGEELKAPSFHATPRTKSRGIPDYAQSSRRTISNPFVLGKFKPGAFTALYEQRMRDLQNRIAEKQRMKDLQNGILGKRKRSTSETDLTAQQPNELGNADPGSFKKPKPDTGIGNIDSEIMELQNLGLLGAWEYSIMNYVPYEEITKDISDFLFQQVVTREDIGVVSNKGVASQGAVFEIEAKIGQVIDKNTNERLSLPVQSECVINRSHHHNARLAFKSSMTEKQHKSLNQFLNNALVQSKTKKEPTLTKPRIEMDYEHTYERDTFYTLSKAGKELLPMSIQRIINPHDPRTIPKLRITTNSKTGEPIAQIIKARVVDMDIYSPKTVFDWRISVNVEMKVEGDFTRYIEPKDILKGNADRVKDRLSYRHLQYQIDLTQVSSPDPAKKAEKEHELEIEVASEEIRKQGLLARNGEPNQFEDLVKGFADNVRILVRHCQY